MSDEKYSIGLSVEYGEAQAAINSAAAAIIAATDIMSKSMQQMAANTDNAMNRAAGSTKTATTKMDNSIKAMANNAKDSFKDVNNAIASVQSMFLKITGLVAGGALFAGVINKTIEWNDQVKKLHQTLGITWQDASVLNVALNHLGIGTDEYAGAAVKLARQLANNSKAFKGLDIDVRNSDGTFKNSQELMTEVIAKLGEMKEGTDRNVAASEIFKRTGIDVNLLLRLTAEEMANAKKKGEELHLIIGPDGAARTRAYKEGLNDLQLVGTSLATSIGEKWIPVLTKLGSWFIDVGKSADKATIANKNFLGVVADTSGPANFSNMLDHITDSFTVLGNAAKKASQNIAAAMASEVGDMQGMLNYLGEANKIGLNDGFVRKNKRDDYAPPKLEAKTPSDKDAPTMPEKGGGEETEYDKAKYAYEAEAAKRESEAALNGQKYTLDQKLALYKQYLADVTKLDDQHHHEPTDYNKGLYELQTAAHKQNSELRIAQLNKEIAEGKAKSQEAYENNLQILQKEVANTLVGSTARIEAETKVVNAQRQYLTEVMVLQKKKLDQDRETAEQGINVEESALKLKAKATGMSAADELAAINVLQAKKRELAEKEITDEIAGWEKLKAQYPELMAFILAQEKALQDQLDVLHGKNLAANRIAADQLTTVITKPWDDLRTQVQNVMASNIAKIVEGTETIKQAFRNMAKSIIDSMIQMGAQSVAQGIMKMVTAFQSQLPAAVHLSTQAVQQGAALMTAASQATTGVQVADAGIAAAAAGAGAAAGAAAATAASASIITSLLPLLLIAGILGAMGGGGGSSSTTTPRSANSYYSSKLPSYDVGTDYVPRTGPAMIHQGEKIVPAGQNSGSGFTHAPTYNVQAMDGRGVERALANNSRQVARGLQKVIRGFNGPNPSKWNLV